MPTKKKLVIGVDFGTTYTGVAFLYGDTEDYKKIEVIQKWAGKVGGLDNKRFEKVPTEISYGPDKTLWGYQIPAGAQRIGCFKLLLDAKTRATVYDDKSIQTGLSVDPGNPNATLRLPPGKTAAQVTEDYLRLLYAHIMERLQVRLHEALDVTPIHFVLTTPAIWSHEAQTATSEAAKRAGFCSRIFVKDTMSMVSEPEAAATFCLRDLYTEGLDLSLNVGDTFVVCDAGGGTVDLITYMVTKMVPDLEVKEAAVGSGGKCGSTMVDRAFMRLLRTRIGPDFATWPAKRTGRGSSLMSKFEDAKRDFGAHEDDQEWKIPVGIVPDNEMNNIEAGEFTLRVSDMEGLFDEAISAITNLVTGQVESTKRDTGKDVKKVLLVGGFGQSEYLLKELQIAFMTRGIRVVQSPSAWSAIARGAVLSGLSSPVSSRRLKYSYGVACGKLFRDGVDDEKDAYLREFDNAKYCKNRISWFARRGQEVKTSESISMDFSKDFSYSVHNSFSEIYGSTSQNAPERVTDEDAFQLGSYYCKYSELPLDAFERKVINGKPIYRAQFQKEMTVGSADIVFQNVYKGETYGQTTLQLDCFECGAAD